MGRKLVTYNSKSDLPLKWKKPEASHRYFWKKSTLWTKLSLTPSRRHEKMIFFEEEEAFFCLSREPLVPNIYILAFIGFGKSKHYKKSSTAPQNLIYLLWLFQFFFLKFYNSTENKFKLFSIFKNISLYFYYISNLDFCFFHIFCEDKKILHSEKYSKNI